MNDDTPILESVAKLAWVTPRLESLGSMRDARADSVQPPNDGSASPTIAAS
ncbi:MAG: hypothetical protein V4610_14325 [Pseudomonadota bacterium]|jgi:hypothetical protein